MRSTHHLSARLYHDLGVRQKWQWEGLIKCLNCTGCTKYKQRLMSRGNHSKPWCWVLIHFSQATCMSTPTVNTYVSGFEKRAHFTQRLNLFLIVHNFKAVIATELKPGITILQSLHYTRCNFRAPPTSGLGVAITSITHGRKSENMNLVSVESDPVYTYLKGIIVSYIWYLMIIACKSQLA